MRQVGRGLVAVLVERVIHCVRMVGNKLRTQRQELAPHRVVLHFAPINPREDIWREAHIHRRLQQAVLDVGDHLRCGQALQHLLNSRHRGDGILLLPAKVAECLRVNVAPGGNRPPELRPVERIADRRAVRLDVRGCVLCLCDLLHHRLSD